ncbi:MAG: pyridoxal phosphate-dependent aminotransferase [Marinifilaceae bacterium]|jgi:aspartate/methionine/tyrosine aminotransferase|nr:pyridoxal phosphate-dependent aminotransferase [Marinifilaceae bacterium]
MGFEKPTGSYISYFSNLVKTNGGINLAQGIPGFEPPKELLNILSEIAVGNFHQYAAGNGNISLRNLIWDKYHKVNSNINLEDIMITNGGTEALTILFTYMMQKFPEGFNSMAFSPVYEVYSQLPKIFRHKCHEFFYSDDFVIDFEKFEDEIIKNNIKLIFINSPGNPFGRVLSKTEYNRIIEMSEKLDFYIILDSVYNELYFENIPYSAVSEISERIFYTNSFSKSFSITGWRLGYVISHSSNSKNIQAIHDYIGLCSPSILQEALAQYLSKFNYGIEYTKELRGKLARSYKKLREGLIEIGFEVPETKGGYFVWAKLPEEFKDSFDYAMKLYNSTKIAVIPGVHFSKYSNNYIRLNIANDEDLIEKALNLIRNFHS